MSFVSTGFIVFLFIGFVIYYIIPKKTQWIFLLCLSMFYYLCSGLKSMAFIVTTCLVTYLGALLIEKIEEKSLTYLNACKNDISKEEKKIIKEQSRSRKKVIMVLVLVINFGILAVIKYLDFAIFNLNGVIDKLFDNTGTITTFSLLLPLGISFYTFQSMGYIIDVYRGKYKPEKNLFEFALFVSFFPQLLQGPIGRFERLSSQFYEVHEFDFERIKSGLQRICWGLFKKLVIADRAGVFVNAFFAGPENYDGGLTILAILAYCIQLYGDFAGGIDVVIGTAEIFGIKMDENFRQPFFSRSISEFWHRWHITLGTWMKDYIFYPFSFSKFMNKFGKNLKKKYKGHFGKVFPICLANLLIFFIVGVWHGAAWKFIAYGMYNGIIIAVSNLLEPLYAKLFSITKIDPSRRIWKIWQIIRTFILVNIGWYFDRADSFTQALYLMKKSLLDFSLASIVNGKIWELGLGKLDFIVLSFGCFVWLIVSLMKERGIEIREYLSERPLIIRWSVYIVLLLSIPIIGYVSEETGGFIYAQF